MVPQPVWLVTGASSGLGAAITSAALRAGHKVIAGARNTSKARKDYPQVEELGGEWLELDVTAPNVKQTITAAIEKAGRIDVVVNNAGFITVAPLEDLRYVIVVILPVPSTTQLSLFEQHTMLSTNH